MNRGVLQGDSRRIFFGLSAAWLVAMASLALPLPGNAVDGVTGDAANGKVLFEKRCTGCHSLDMDKEGPRLRGVYGRTAGTVASFRYSDAFKGAHFQWDGESLQRWLTDTQQVLPENDMDFRVPKAEERADIIAYLRSLSEKR